MEGNPLNTHKTKATVKTKNTQKLIESIKQAAQTYAGVMVGKTFLYVFEGRYIEVVFRTKDFLHLTGIQTSLTPKEFYKESIRGSLMSNQIKKFSSQHPYNLCEKKLTQLVNISKVTNSPIFILEDLKTQTFTYKFGLTELNFTVCLSHDTDYNGKTQSSCFVPRSLRVEDSFGRESDAFEVNFIFSKSNNEKKYSTIAYQDSKASIDNLPEEIKALLTEGLVSK